jgi:hypothetical protein
MNIMDNSPIDAPAIGKIVTESFEVEQLTDCHLYLLPSNTKAFANKATEVFGMLMEKMGASRLLNDYKFDIINESLSFDNQPLLKTAINEEKANFILPLYTPDKSEKQYLIVRSEEKDLFAHIPLMIYTSERISKYSIMEQMKWYGQDNPEAMQDFIKEEVDTDAFWKRYAAASASNMMHPTFGMAVSKAALKDKLGIKGKITHLDKLKMMERIEENFVKSHRDELADAELMVVFSSMDVHSLRKFANMLNKNQRSKLAEIANVKKLAENASTWLEVRFAGKIESGHRTKGRYRLYITDGKKDELVEFDSSDSFLVYLLFLIDKVLKDEVDTLDFDKYKDLFVKLSWEVYRFCDGEEHFKKITKGRDDKGNAKERRLSDCLGDIKISVSDACNKLGALPAPYIIEDADEHLYVEKQDIMLPKELTDVINKWSATI